MLHKKIEIYPQGHPDMVSRPFNTARCLPDTFAQNFHTPNHGIEKKLPFCPEMTKNRPLPHSGPRGDFFDIGFVKTPVGENFHCGPEYRLVTDSFGFLTGYVCFDLNCICHL